MERDVTFVEQLSSKEDNDYPTEAKDIDIFILNLSFE